MDAIEPNTTPTAETAGPPRAPILAATVAAALLGMAGYVAFLWKRQADAEASGVASARLLAYWFPEGKSCTVMVDFQARRTHLEGLDPAARKKALAEALVAEFATNRGQKAAECETARLLAVYVPGMDHYGRPDFGSRVNLLRIEGPTSAITALPADVDLEKLGPGITHESY